MSWLLFDQQHHDEAFASAALLQNDSAISSHLVEATIAADASDISYDPVTPVVLNVLRILWFGFLYNWYRQWLNGRWYTDFTRRLDGRVCIVTGANSGIGLYTADELFRRGAHVVLACRDRQRAEAAKRWICERHGKGDRTGANSRIRVAQLDLADMQSVRQFATNFLRDDIRIDILINNAGVMAVPTDCRTTDGFEPHMGINHYGTFLLTLLLIGRMRRTALRDSQTMDGHGAGHAVRIVNVSSKCHQWVAGDRKQLEAGLDGNHYHQLDRFRAYAVSKLAGVLATRGLAHRLGRTGVTVNAVHPGVVHTQIPRHLGRFSWLFNRHICALFSWLFLRTPLSGSQSVVYAAVDMNLDYITGQYINDLWFEKANPLVDNDVEVDWFWRHSERVVGLTFEQACNNADLEQSDGPDETVIWT